MAHPGGAKGGRGAGESGWSCSAAAGSNGSGIGDEELMSDLPARLRRLPCSVREIDAEYRRLSQEGQEASFHVWTTSYRRPHRVRPGRTTSPLLVSRSSRKEARRFAVDPMAVASALFHPRRQRWHDPLSLAGVRILGRTPTGERPAPALRMNRPLILAIREEETHVAPASAGCEQHHYKSKL